MSVLRKVFSFIQKNELQIYFILLLCIVFTFSFSRYILRAWEIILVSVFILSGNYRNKLHRLLENKALLVLSSYFLLNLIGLLYTPDLAHGVRHIRVVLPWLGIPIIIGSYPGFSEKQFYLILQVYIGGVFLHTIISFLAYLGVLPFWEFTTFRDIGLFYHHVRFAITIVLAIFFLVYFITTKRFQSLIQTGIYIAILIWLTGFLFFSKIMTGILVFIIITGGYIIYLLFKRHNVYFRLGMVSFVLFVVIISSFKLYNIYENLWGMPPISEIKLPDTTRNGTPYNHIKDPVYVSNGHYENLYLCEKELRKQWNKRSDIGYNEKAKGGNQSKIKYILKRYLTSKSLTKDSVGLSKLDKRDIKAIENGVVNYKFTPYDFLDRVYLIAREVYQYQISDKPRGTLSARLHSLKLGWRFFLEKPVFGHGTHSPLVLFKKFYKKQNATGRNYIWVHNQYVYFLIEFGIVGLIWFFVSILFPYIKMKGYNYFLFNCIFAYYLIASTMNNTFRSQLALTLWVTFFSVFFVYLNTEQKTINKKK